MNIKGAAAVTCPISSRKATSRFVFSLKQRNGISKGFTKPPTLPISDGTERVNRFGAGLEVELHVATSAAPAWSVPSFSLSEFQIIRCFKIPDNFDISGFFINRVW